MKFGRRGQGAMEYLMTYGWAILVVMIVGIVMWQLGIFNIGGTTVTMTGFPRIKPQLAATGIKASDGSLNGVFTNGVGTKIRIISANVTDSASTAACSGTQVNVDGATLPSSSISAGSNFRLSTGTNNCVATGQNVGDVYLVNVALTYNVTIGTVTTQHTDSGTLRGPLE